MTVALLPPQGDMSEQLGNVVLEDSTCLGRPSMEHFPAEDFGKTDTHVNFFFFFLMEMRG